MNKTPVLSDNGYLLSEPRLNKHRTVIFHRKQTVTKEVSIRISTMRVLTFNSIDL